MAVIYLSYPLTFLLEGEMFHYVTPRYESFSIVYKACFLRGCLYFNLYYTFFYKNQ